MTLATACPLLGAQRMNSFLQQRGLNQQSGSARLGACIGTAVITTVASSEHHSVLHAFEHLGKTRSFRVTFLSFGNRGRVDPVS